MVGQTISHYKILEKLGEGGMGVVYKAEDTKLKRTIALKFLPSNLMYSPEAKQRFLHEAQAAAALEHPNICNIHEIAEAKEQVFMVMSWVDGQNLKEKIDSGPLKINEILNIAAQTAGGLQEAHEKGTVHRDIKSDNIMIDRKNQVKILDFGLAKLKNQTRLTRSGFRLGTAAYMSPEQAQGADVDHRTDIWSLGVVLYEMMTGQLPFKGEYEQAVIYSILNIEPEPVSSLRADAPVELERIVNKALSKDPSKRYQQASDLIVDLRKLKKDPDWEAGTVSAKFKTPKSTKKTIKRLMIPGILLLTAVIVVTGYFIFKGKQEPLTPVTEPGSKPSLAILNFENNSGDESLENWRSGLPELLVTDLSQSKYIRVLRSDQVYSIFKRLNLLEVKKYSTEDFKKIAKKGRVNHILKGSYIKAGDNFVITAMLINAITGETISSLSVKADGENNIFARVDDLTKKIKLELDLTPDQIAADMDKEVGKITTSSHEAYKYYAEGRKYHNEGEYPKSIQLMKKAVAIDPHFAMAYRSMGMAFYNFGDIGKYKKYLEKAMELSARLSDREKYIIRGDFYSLSDKTFNKAIEAYNKLLRLYPDDGFGNTNLALVYLWLEEWDRAIERIEVLIQNNDEAVHPYFLQSEAYACKGLYDRGRKVLENYLVKFPDNAVIHRYLIIIYICQGKYDLALIESDKAYSLDHSDYHVFWGKGIIFSLMGDIISAEKEFRKCLASKELLAPPLGKNGLGALYLLQGRFQEAKQQIKQGIELAAKRDLNQLKSWLHSFLAYINLKSKNKNQALKEFDKALDSALKADMSHLWEFALNGKGLTYLEMNSMDKAKATAEELKTFIQEGMNKKSLRFYYHLMGMIELNRKNSPGATEYFKKAISLLHSEYYSTKGRMHALFIEPLALTYFKSGDLEKAQKEFERITSLTFGRYNHGDIYARAFYTLGKIYQQKGWKGKAIESYNKFIDLWKNCDPRFQPMVDDARKRVKELSFPKGKN
jgi:serine/threonine protein kinase/predicted Zn-dependent protease